MDKDNWAKLIKRRPKSPQPGGAPATDAATTATPDDPALVNDINNKLATAASKRHVQHSPQKQIFILILMIFACVSSVSKKVVIHSSL